MADRLMTPARSCRARRPPQRLRQGPRGLHGGKGRRRIDVDRERETAPSPKNAGWTTPDEIVAVMRFLCSDAAAAVNGQRIALGDRA